MLSVNAQAEQIISEQLEPIFNTLFEQALNELASYARETMPSTEQEQIKVFVAEQKTALEIHGQPVDELTRYCAAAMRRHIMLRLAAYKLL
jgi:hypothetical protein